MFCDEGKHTQYLYLAPSIPVEVQEGVLDCPVLLPQNDCADVAAIISWDSEVESFDESTLDELFAGTDGVDVVLVSAGCDDAPPSSLEGLFQLFHL